MEEIKRKFEGIWIPKEIWLDEDLSIQEKVMLVEINSLDNENGCYASNDYFAKFFKFSKARASQIINALEQKQFITINYIYKGKEVEKRIIHISDLGIKYFKYGIKFSKCNNITNNNINIINDINNTSNFSNKKIKNESNTSKNIIKEKKLTKKQLKEKKEQEEQIKINDLIDKYTDNIDIQELLEQYIEVRKNRANLTSAQFYIMLDDLKKECGQDIEYTKNCIKKAIAGGWSQIVFIDKFKGNAKTSYSSVDNTANHKSGNPKISDLDFRFMTFESRKDYISHMDLADMTKDQREFFDKYCLARDENGNLLKF